jgi:hypothetical protein
VILGLLTVVARAYDTPQRYLGSSYNQIAVQVNMTAPAAGPLPVVANSLRTALVTLGECKISTWTEEYGC